MIHKTAGGVLFNKDATKVYLIHKIDRDEWLLPKGHVEDESLVDTAKREIYEETGYNSLVISPPITTTQFVMPDGDTKNMTIFTAIAYGKQHKTPERLKEGLGGGWFTIKEALQKAQYENIKDTIKLARKQIRKIMG